VSLAVPASASPHPTTASHSPESEPFKARVGPSEARAGRNSTSHGVPANNAVSLSLSLAIASPSSVSGLQPPCRRSGIPDATMSEVRKRIEPRRWLALSQRCSRDLEAPRRSAGCCAVQPTGSLHRASRRDSPLIRASPGTLFRRMKTPLLLQVESFILPLIAAISLLLLSASPARARERESERGRGRGRESAANNAAVSVGAACGLARFLFPPPEDCYYTLLKCEGDISVGRRGEGLFSRRYCVRLETTVSESFSVDGLLTRRSRLFALPLLLLLLFFAILDHTRLLSRFNSSGTVSSPRNISRCIKLNRDFVRDF